MKRAILILITGSIQFCFAQKNISQINSHVYLSKAEHFSEFQISEDKSEVKPSEEKQYYWYKTNDLHTSFGGYEGKLLEGTYIDYYSNGNLKEKGEFQKGVKHGKWVSWWPGGKISEILHYKSGVLNGECKTFTEKGDLTILTNYRSGKLHGKYQQINPEGTINTRYKNGKEIVRIKPRTEQESKEVKEKSFHFMSIFSFKRLKEHYKLRKVKKNDPTK